MLCALMTRRPDKLAALLPLRPVEFHILLALAEGDLHGYAIRQEAAQRSGGEVLLEPGTLYRALRRLLEAGLVAERRPDGADTDERRRTYRLTDLGRRAAAAEAERMAELVTAARRRRLV
jgi:DNA-binding PadR family transcriptional regulator